MANEQDEIGIALQDNPEEDAPEDKSKTTPSKPEAEDTKVMLSSKEHQELIRQAKAAANLGRNLKATLDAHSVLQRNYDLEINRRNDMEKVIQVQRQKERERELKAAEGTPDVIDSIRLKHQAEDEMEKVTKARSEFERERSQYQTELDEAAKFKATQKANELAKESGLTADILLLIGSDTAENGKVTYNLKRMESIAKTVPKGEEEEEEEAEEGKSPVRGQRSRVSSLGSRSATRGLSTITDYYEAYNRGQISNKEMEEAKKRFGVAY